MNALQQRVFWKQVTALESRKSTEDFKGDLRNRVLQFEGLPESMFVRAKQIAERTTASLGTRSLDLLHVACALELGGPCRLFSTSGSAAGPRHATQAEPYVIGPEKPSQR